MHPLVRRSCLRVLEYHQVLVAQPRGRDGHLRRFCEGSLLSLHRTGDMEACLRVLVHIRNGRGQPARRAHGCQDAQRNEYVCSRLCELGRARGSIQRDMQIVQPALPGKENKINPRHPRGNARLCPRLSFYYLSQTAGQSNTHNSTLKTHTQARPSLSPWERMPNESSAPRTILLLHPT